MRCEHGDNPCYFIARGIKYLTPIIAFFEFVIWLLAKRSRDKGSFFNIANFLAFAFGFAMGTLSDS